MAFFFQVLSKKCNFFAASLDQLSLKSAHKYSFIYILSVKENLAFSIFGEVEFQR